MRFIFPIILAVCGVGVLLALAFWQMGRLDEKTAYLAEIESRMLATPVALPDVAERVRDEYLRVRVRGSLTGEEIAVLRGDKIKGAGYRIIAPLQTDSGRRILVDLGFVRASDKDTARLGQIEITGNLSWTSEKNSDTPAPDLDAGIWFARDVDDSARHLASEPILIVASEVLARDGDAAAWLPALSPQALNANIPNDHWEYMMTWFALAAVWLAMSGYWMRRLTQKKEA